MLNTLLTATALTDTLQASVNTDNGKNAFGFVVALFFALVTVALYFNDIKLGALAMGAVTAVFLTVGIFAPPILTIDAPAVQSHIAANTGVVLNTDTLNTAVYKAKENVGDKIAFTDGDVLGYITVTELSSEGAEIEYKLHH